MVTDIAWPIRMAPGQSKEIVLGLISILIVCPSTTSTHMMLITNQSIGYDGVDCSVGGFSNAGQSESQLVFYLSDFLGNIMNVGGWQYWFIAYQTAGVVGIGHDFPFRLIDSENLVALSWDGSELTTVWLSEGPGTYFTFSCDLI